MKLYCCGTSVDKLEVDERASTIARDYRFTVVPNPVHSNMFTIQLSEAIQGHATRLRVINNVGEMVIDRPMSREEYTPTVDANGWPNGAYFVEIVHDIGVAGQKLTIQR